MDSKDGTITVVLADDHVIVRQGIRSLLQGRADFRVVGEASDGLEAIQVTERLQPSVLLLDLGMEKIDGLEVIRQVMHRAEKTSVVILSMRADERHVVDALQAGAKGYVLKGADADELMRAIREAAAGRRYLSTLLSQQAIASYAHARASPEGRYERLTPREREIVLLVASGHNNSRIAEQLVISRRTVEVHRARAMQKLGITSMTGLIRYALDAGLVDEQAQDAD